MISSESLFIAGDVSPQMMFSLFGGFQLVMGGTPIAGWFGSWKIPSFEMDDDWGYRLPPFMENPHMTSIDKFDYCKMHENGSLDCGSDIT